MAGTEIDIPCLDAMRGLRPPLNIMEIDHVCEILAQQVKEWRDGGSFGKFPALHNWIRERRWEAKKPARPVQLSAADRVKRLKEQGHI